MYGKRATASSNAPDLNELGHVIDAAVERHLISDVPLGVFLSGGIDSTIIAEAATRISGNPVETFSISFDEPSFDESSSFDFGREGHWLQSSRAHAQCRRDARARAGDRRKDG